MSILTPRSSVRPLNQLDSISGRVDRHADDEISERALIAAHRTAGGFDSSDGRVHVPHVQNDVRDRILRRADKPSRVAVNVTLSRSAAGKMAHATSWYRHAPQGAAR